MYHMPSPLPFLPCLSVPDNSSMTVLKSYVLFQPVPWALTALT